MNYRKAALSAIAAIGISNAFCSITGAQEIQNEETYRIGERLLGQETKSDDTFREITWDDLIPADWLPENLLGDLFDDDNLDELDDADPRAMEFLKKLREIWDSAPVVEKMANQKVRLPGFVVPLEGDEKNIHEFLLVPYFGACIHVPPPPANQLIHVIPEKPVKASLNMMPVWVKGELGIERYDSEMGLAGYRMRAIEVLPYE